MALPATTGTGRDLSLAGYFATTVPNWRHGGPCRAGWRATGVVVTESSVETLATEVLRRLQSL